MECLSSGVSERPLGGGRAKIENSSRRHPRKFGQKRFLAVRRSWGKWGGLFLGYLLGKNFRWRDRDHLVPPRRTDAAVCRAQVCYPFGRKHGRHRAVKRRDFITLVGGAAAAWPLAARAQQSSKIARIGYLSTANPRSAPNFAAFEQRLRELGYMDGQNIVIEYRDAEGDVDRLPDLAADLVRLDVNVIVTTTDPATRAAKRATTTIPILMVAINYDPVALGYVDSIARPGANITGLFFQHLELLAKRFGLFKEMLPSVSRVAVLSDSLTSDQLGVVEAANRLIGLELQPLVLQNPPYDFENAFRVAMRSRAEAIIVLESASIFRGRTQIAQVAMKNRLPTSFAFREYVEVGGLVSYGVNFAAMYRRAAEYADRILRGTKPVDLPVELSTKFELVMNLKTAKALGIEVPPTLLARADEVIE